MHDSKAKVLRLLTLNDVIYLSKKKEELSWGDFEKYQYKEGGSGLYIRYYEIETQWKLFIGGGDLKEKPLYITLENSITGDGFDIRENDAELMINRIKNGCEQKMIEGTNRKVQCRKRKLIKGTILAYQQSLKEQYCDSELAETEKAGQQNLLFYDTPGCEQ